MPKLEIDGNKASASVHLGAVGHGGVGKNFVSASLQYFRTESGSGEECSEVVVSLPGPHQNPGNQDPERTKNKSAPPDRTPGY